MAEQRVLRQIAGDYEELKLSVREGRVVEELRRIPMRDGALMKTYLFHMEENGLEQGGKRYPVILQRSPYPEAEDIYREHGRGLAKRGFVYVLQWCRGVGGSEGEWNPNENERRDGLDTVQYLTSCRWVKNIGFWGDSYLALTGWCMADAVPEQVKGMYLGVYGTDRYCSLYEKRMFRHDVFTGWAMDNAGVPIEADYLESCRYRPHCRVDEELWGVRLPWYRKMISSVKEEDAYWQEGFWKQLREIPGKVKIPLFVREGWYDHHLGSAIRSFEALGEEAKKHSTFQIGCWNHNSEDVLEWCEAGELQNSEVMSMVPWFYRLLVEEKLPEPGVELYAIGDDRWIRGKEWPLPVKEIRKWYLSGDHTLTRSAGTVEESYRYEYDPDNPVPSLGAESMLRDLSRVGSLYQLKPGYREDVISFLSGPMEEDFMIAGRIRVSLTVSSDCEDTAFTARVMAEEEEGRFVNIRSSITTIEADHGKEPYRPGQRCTVRVDMWDIVWKVKKGKRLRVDISSSDFPQYAAHTNYKGIWSEQKECRRAHQTIFAGEQNSCVEFPVYRGETT